jgi:hypothetical protein
MMMLWAWAGVPLGVYNIVSDFNVALRIQPQILTALSLVTWVQCYYYQRVRCNCHLYGWDWGLTRGSEMVRQARLHCHPPGCGGHGRYPSRPHRWPPHSQEPSRRMAYDSHGRSLSCSSRRRCAPSLLDIWVHRTVRGISFLFVGIDAAGDVFSLVSILFQPTLDILGIVIYATEFVLWCGIFLCGGYYNFIPWMRKWLARRSAGDPPSSSSGSEGPTTTGIALHGTPSSTSVFRTASSEIAGMRPRAVQT